MMFALAAVMTDTLFQLPVTSRPLDLPLPAQLERILRLMAHQASHTAHYPRQSEPDAEGGAQHSTAEQDVGHSDPGAEP